MRNTRARRVGMVTLFGVLVLSIGLVRLVFMTGSAGAVPPVKEDALAGVIQNWDKNFPSASRFTVLAAFGGAAVRDNNTGLVWEQAPAATLRPWSNVDGATNYCANKPVGGTRGWRLPSVAELASLIDPSLPAPFVPGNVFAGVQSSTYWSATLGGGNPEIVWDVNFGSGVVDTPLDKTDLARAWCVRGPMNADAY